MSLLLEPRQEPSCRGHVVSILVAEPLDELLFFDPCSSNEKAERHQTGHEQEPVSGYKAAANDGHDTRHIERMPHKAVRAGRHKRVILPRNHRVRQVLSEISECPDKKESSESDQDEPKPAQPDWNRNRRPRHPLRVYHPSDASDEERNPAQPRSEQDESPFLPAVELLAGVGSASVVDAKWNKESDHDQESSAEEFVGHFDDSTMQG